MKARIIEQPVMVYSQPDINSISITQVPVGNEVEIGAAKKKDGKTWINVTLPNGQRGYMAGDTKIYQIKLATLVQANTNVYSMPSAMSAALNPMKKNTRFYLLDNVKQGEDNWVKIRNMTGGEGYIDGKTKIRVIAEAAKATRASASRNMVFGALWCIGGILVTAITYSAASSGGGTYFVAWGAILFGGLQFLQGLVQFLSATD